MLSISYRIGEGITWEVISSFMHISEPCIVIPTSTVKELTPEDIGSIVKELAQCGGYIRAASFAQWILNNQGKNPDLPSFLFDEYGEQLKDLTQYAGKTASIDKVLALIERAERLALSKSHTPGKRREIQRSYDSYFLKIGRRDGFACKHCGRTTNDLEIDHRIAVSIGGTNDLGNLQLLCQACNRKKSNRE